ncbi:MAG: nucleotidyl transferase AbiEii/AbiGii toxin family protein [Actinobacteria bacterium]|nr:nucleotidyl transferase AbiEii/AbiGii toxin family protein [Actinomycetota bacterium]
MINIEQLQSYYPDNLKHFKRNILREYLQYKILEIIFNSVYYNNLVFMGGTAIHIIYGNTRFSQDLDFDNLGLVKKTFSELSEIIKNKLELEGYNVETKNTFKGAFRSYIKISDLIFNLQLSNHKEEKIDIRLDAESQNFDYFPDKPFINKFDIFLQIYTVPIEILLSQKIYSIFNRSRPMGRDFFDTIFLLGKTRPNYKYIKAKLNLDNSTKLKEALLSKCENLDFNRLASDVSPYLFNPSDSSKVSSFEKYIESIEL